MTGVKRILFVCLGNICRSPLAEGIATARARSVGLELEFDSAGTGAWHVGAAPDPRARAVAQARGTPIDALRARQVCRDDYSAFDLILAADRDNLSALQRLRPDDARAEVALLLDWVGLGGEVPDPYYGDEADFERVYALLDQALDALLRRIAHAANAGPMDTPTMRP